jgi:hypothetical protein
MLVPARLPASSAELSLIVRKLSRTQLLSFDTSTQHRARNSFVLIHLQIPLLQLLSIDTSIQPPGWRATSLAKGHAASQHRSQRVARLLLLSPLGATMLSVRETSPLVPVSNQMSGPPASTFPGAFSSPVLRERCHVQGGPPSGAGKAHRVRLG